MESLTNENWSQREEGVGVMNTWPGGTRKALNQDDHERWNASHYPGTRQICTVCVVPTTFCEEDGYFDDDMQPYCFECALTHGLRGEW